MKRTKLPKRLGFLQEAQNRESFFNRIALIWPRSDPRYIAIERAYDTAKDAFRHEIRDGGERYFEHLRAVALILIEHLRVRDHELIITALLHDLVEDIRSWTIERVRREFGERVAFLLDYLTKPSKKEYPDKDDRDHAYHYRFRAAPRDFFLIKLADRLHNLLTLAFCPEEKRARKIKETREHYLPYAEKEQLLIHELEEALAAVK